MVSKSGWPAGMSLHERTWASGLYSCCRISTWRSWSAWSQGRSGWEGVASTRTGRVLMNRPTMASIPSSGTERPEETAPKTTSSSPLARARRSAQAPCIRVFRVSWWRRTKPRRAPLVSGGTGPLTTARPAGPALSPPVPAAAARSIPRGVGAAKPASIERKKPSAGARSRPSSQAT